MTQRIESKTKGDRFESSVIDGRVSKDLNIPITAPLSPTLNRRKALFILGGVIVAMFYPGKIFAQEQESEEVIPEDGEAIETSEEIVPTSPAEVELINDEIVTPRPFEERLAEALQDPIYTQWRDAAGTIIKAPTSVDPKLLDIAEAKTERMLAYRKDLREKLAYFNTQMVILPKNMKLTELPEFSYLTGVPTPQGTNWDNKRGIGSNGIISAGAVGEERLEAQDIALGAWEHEQAHNIQIGFTPDDRTKLLELYIKYRDTEIFGNSYVIYDRNEFFAVMSQIYTGGTTDQVFARSSTGQVISTPDDILAKTPDVYQFLANIYGPREGK